MNWPIILGVILFVAFLAFLWWLSGRSFENRRIAAANPMERDNKCIDRGICPDCGVEGKLLQGPAAGMGMNIACDNCLSEFMVAFGFGTGAFMVKRMGKLTQQRARLYGIGPEQVAISLSNPQ